MIYNNLNLVCNSSNAALVFTSMACNSAISKVGPSRDKISLIRETKSTSDKEFEINLGNDFSSLTWNISSNNPFSMSSITSHFLGISLLLASLSILIFSDFGISVLNCTNLSFNGLSGYSGIWDFFGIHFSYVSLNNKLCEMCIVTAISHSNRILYKETYVIFSIFAPKTLDTFRPYGIINTKGENPPNEKGELLCNGHCNWETCRGYHGPWKCLNCNYIQCGDCFFDGVSEYEKFMGWNQDIEYEYDPLKIPCRNCGIIGGEVQDLEVSE